MKILAITSIRSDYDLMSSLYKMLHKDESINIQLLVTGAHLSKSYGYSVKNIEADGLEILAKVETLIDSDSKQSRLKTASLLLQNSIDIIVQYNPDVILYVGDREDVIIGALLGGYLEIPTIHFWGGDHATDGNIDNPIRHATSKLSSIHMVALPQHKKRLIRIGEPPQRIFTIGNMALDQLVSCVPLPKQKIKEQLNIQEKFEEFALVIFHPLPQERDEYYINLSNILSVLFEENICAFISAPNTDPGNKQAFDAIDEFREHPGFYYFGNLERDIFHSIYKQSQFIIGNSSSGIVESTSIPIPAINVGMRQLNRYSAENVIFTQPSKGDIRTAIKKARSETFLNLIKDISNPYGEGNSTLKAYNLIKELSFKDFLRKPEDPLTEDYVWKP